MRRVVLDASAFDVLDGHEGLRVRRLLLRVLALRGDICCSAVTLAEVCRGTARTRRVEVALARDRGGAKLRVAVTDVAMAKLVGALLHQAGAGSELLGDAHVVAACAGAERAIVISSDADDIVRLAAGLPGTRIVVRRPDAT